MNKLPLVSILIPLYNAEKYLHECLKSIISQVYKNIEVIIVDDGSTDTSLDIAKSYKKQYENIKIYTQENSGASAARNKAFSMSKGTYIQYFDADDILHPEKISLQIDAMKMHNFNPKVAATGKWLKFFDEIYNACSEKQIINRDYDDILLFFKESWENKQYVIGQSWLIHRRLNEEIGGWNTDISVNDDGEFFARVAYNLDKILYIDKSIVYWRQDNPSSLSKNKTWEGEYSQLYVLDHFYEIVKMHSDYQGLKKALAIRYSVRLPNIYPKYPDLADKALYRISQLGYSHPIYLSGAKLPFLINIFGVKGALYIWWILKRLLKR